jgi:asparagine synthase (glutamine-hydrolysing)
MGKLCGWIDEERKDAADLLARMLSGTEAPPFAAAGPACVAVRSDVTPGTVANVDGVLVAIEGRSRGPDATELARLYARHGPQCLEQVSGSFALAIVDSRTGNALLAVDRMGTRGLCYANPAGKMIFASGADALAAHPDVGSELSNQALFNYLYCHMVPSPGTIYRAIQKLQPGECVVFHKGVAEQRFYWRMHYTDRAHEAMDTLEERFRNLLRESVKRALCDEAQVGAFLSGGTDSSTVTGLLTELCGAPART